MNMNAKRWKTIEKTSILLVFLVAIPFAIIFVNWPRGTSINGLVAGLLVVQSILVIISAIAKRLASGSERRE